MRIAIVFDPDPDLGPDPLDHAKAPRRLGEFIDDNVDAFIAWREWGDQFDGGYRTHFIGQGIWENLSDDQQDAIDGILDGTATIEPT